MRTFIYRELYVCQVSAKSENLFFYMEILCKIFPTFKLEIEFYSHKKVVSPKLENCAHLYIVNFMCAKFQKNQRTFFDQEGGRSVGRSVHYHGCRRGCQGRGVAVRGTARRPFFKSDFFSFYIEFPWNFFFTWKSFVKIFPNLKLEIEFYAHKKVVSPKLENSAHLFILKYKCSNFERNRRTFFSTIHHHPPPPPSTTIRPSQ